MKIQISPAAGACGGSEGRRASGYNLKHMQSQNVQFGCGTCAPPSWLNFDAGPAFLLEKRLPFLKAALVRRGFPDYPKNIHYGDVIKGLPVEPGSAQRVYCSHVLEHLALQDCRQALRNVYSYLRPGGVFRFVLPDLEYYAKEYLHTETPGAAQKFMGDTLLGEHEGARGLKSLPRAIFGRSQHLWMWDYKSFVPELATIGFTSIRRASFGDSRDPAFAEVENEGRWINCLGVECRRAA